MHENVITGAGCWGMKQVGRASSRGGGLISDCRSRFDGRVGGCSDGTGMKQAALPFMNKWKHDSM